MMRPDADNKKKLLLKDSCRYDNIKLYIQRYLPDMPVYCRETALGLCM